MSGMLVLPQQRQHWMFTLLNALLPTRIANWMQHDIFRAFVELRLPQRWPRPARPQSLFHWHVLITHSLFYIPSVTHR